jgi:hypothetical protein
MLHHPHVHCIVPAGGLSPDRSRWVSCRKGFLLPIRVVQRLYRGKFLAYLAEAARAGKLQFAGVTAPLAEPSGFAAFLRKQRRKKWIVYAKAPFGSPEQVLKYLARYTHRVAISDSRILRIDGDTVTFSYKDRRDGNRQRTMTLGGVEFLRRFLLHILPKGFVRIRYYGLFANRVRADNLARCRELLSSEQPPSPAPSSPAKPESANDDRHRCPCCGTGRMRRVGTLEPTPVPALDAWLPIPRDNP